MKRLVFALGVLAPFFPAVPQVAGASPFPSATPTSAKSSDKDKREGAEPSATPVAARSPTPKGTDGGRKKNERANVPRESSTPDIARPSPATNAPRAPEGKAQPLSREQLALANRPVGESVEAEENPTKRAKERKSKSEVVSPAPQP